MRRGGIAVQAIPLERWIEFFRLVAGRPVLWENAGRLVRRMAQQPQVTVAEIVAGDGLGIPPAGWRDDVPNQWRVVLSEAHDENRERVAHFLLGRLLAGLRGRVPVTEVAAAVGQEMMTMGDGR
jgi:hypothetical protein